MKKLLKPLLLLFFIQAAFAGMVKAQLITLPRGGNKKASVSEQIGITDVIIHYSRPGVKKREGHIWGELIPVGFTQLGYGAKNPAPGGPVQMRTPSLSLLPMLKLRAMICLPEGMAFS